MAWRPENTCTNADPVHRWTYVPPILKKKKKNNNKLAYFVWLCCLKLQQIDYIVLLHLVQFTARFVQETIKYSNSNRVFCTIEGRDNKIQVLTVFGWKLSQLCLGYCEHVGEYESKSKSLRQYLSHFAFCGSSFSVSRLAVFMESLLFAGVINCLTPSSSPRWLLTAP